MVFHSEVDPSDYFTKEKLDELQVLFDKFDTSGDGSIGLVELYEIFSKQLKIKLTKQQLEAVIREIDEDESGEIEFDEFCVLMIKLQGARPRADCINPKDYLDEKTRKKLVGVFGKYDTSGDGSIDADEMATVFKDMGLDLDAEQVAAVISEVDKDKSGEIEFDEFCAMWAVLSKKKKLINYREYLKPEQVTSYFKTFTFFDTSGDGNIDVRELDALFRRLGVILSKEQIDACVKEYDVDGSGEIEFDEFCVMMCRLKGEKKKRKLCPGETTVHQMQEEGFSVNEMKMAGFGYRTMANEGIPAFRLRKEGGATPLELRRAGFGPVALKKVGIGAQDLRYCGFSSTDLRNAGFSTMSVQYANKEINRSLSTGDLSKLPQTHPQEPFKPGCQLPLHMTPRIRQNVDWHPDADKKNSVLATAGKHVMVARKVLHSMKSFHDGGSKGGNNPRALITASCSVQEPSLQKESKSMASPRLQKAGTRKKLDKSGTRKV